MRKVGITLAAALALAAAGTTTASAADTTLSPCQTQQFLFQKYGIVLEMHQQQVEETYSYVCQQTG